MQLFANNLPILMTHFWPLLTTTRPNTVAMTRSDVRCPMDTLDWLLLRVWVYTTLGLFFGLFSVTQQNVYPLLGASPLASSSLFLLRHLSLALLQNSESTESATRTLSYKSVWYCGTSPPCSQLSRSFIMSTHTAQFRPIPDWPHPAHLRCLVHRLDSSVVCASPISVLLFISLFPFAGHKSTSFLFWGSTRPIAARRLPHAARLNGQPLPILLVYTAN